MLLGVLSTFEYQEKNSSCTSCTTCSNLICDDNDTLKEEPIREEPKRIIKVHNHNIEDFVSELEKALF